MLPKISSTSATKESNEQSGADLSEAGRPHFLSANAQHTLGVLLSSTMNGIEVPVTDASYWHCLAAEDSSIG